MKKKEMEAFITGIGWVSKESMGHPGHIQLFDQNTTLPGIRGKDILDHPHKPFGRMDTFSKLGFAAIAFAMKDAGFKKDGEKKDISMIASTVTGCLETDITFQETMLKKIPSPTIFAYTLASSFLGEASIYFDLTGESFVISEEKTTGLKGLFMALEIIYSGESDIVLCGLCNSDIKIINSSANINKPGSLFFVIEKEKSLNSHGPLNSYGKVGSTSMEKFYFQEETKITGLYDLARKCHDRKI